MIFNSLSDTVFVYAVCGTSQFINELSLSLSSLRRHSTADIVVVTDKRRNEIPIPYNNVLHVNTPDHLSNHQASIFLKTYLHRILPVGPRYCYLDSDIFAVSSSVDDIFSASTAPVIFAADSCRLNQFSPYATKCQCMETNSAERQEINTILAEAYKSCSGSHAGWSPVDYERNSKCLSVRALAYLEHRLTPRSISQVGETRHQVWKSFWFESRTQKLYEPNDVIRFVENSSDWRRDKRRQSWISPSGNDVFNLRCNHLIESVWSTFGIKIRQSCWQHWNGGVYLFDQRAHQFLDAWHDKTMHIFTLPGWRTRDQGTLIATVWEFGLENQTLLPSHFNCILDANQGATMVSEKGDKLTTDAFLTSIKPALAHVFNRVGDPSWDVWRWVDAHAFQQ